MVKLTSPLMHGGRIVPAGVTICLDAELETTLIRNNHAELVEQDPEPEQEPKPKPEPRPKPKPKPKPEPKPEPRPKPEPEPKPDPEPEQETGSQHIGRKNKE